MSNISRRDFLKTAGVMTLAVAAAGVLAGCEGNKPAEVPTEITKDSVTVGNYTFGIDDVKHYAAKSYDPDGKVITEKHYIVTVFNVKAVDESKVAAVKPNFVLEMKPTNATRVDAESVSMPATGTATGIIPADIKEVMNKDIARLPDENTGTVTINNYDNPTSTGVLYYAAYEIETYSDNVFKTPALDIFVNDADGHVYTKLSVAVPAIEDVLYSKLVTEVKKS